MTASLAHVTLVVREYDEAIDFFTRAMDFVLLEDSPRPDGKRWVVVSPFTHGTGLLLAKAATPQQQLVIGNQTGGRVGFFLCTDDFSSTYDRMRSHGVEFVEAPRHESYGIVAVFLDLYGNKWDLLEYKAA